jgi:hypothetical protein
MRSEETSKCAATTTSKRECSATFLRRSESETRFEDWLAQPRAKAAAVDH